MIDELLALDRALFVFLHGLGNERFDWLWLLITKQFNWIPIFIVIAYLVFKHLGWRHALLIMVIMTLLITFTDQTTNLIKNAFQRLRPVNEPLLGEFVRKIQIRKSYSFFSGHASTSMSCAVFLFLTLKPYLKYMGFIFLWPLIFAYSRIYLGLHYPLDIVCGYIYGALAAILMWGFYKLVRNKIFPEKENLDHPTNA